MKELLRKIDSEYGFKLTEDELDRIAKEAEERALRQRLAELEENKG